ncbi:MAG: DUF2185 domain-containing protein [Acetatifactor sp.]|nr:DUF2185 domain-containing protein [Acetatifactor sp.]MDE7113052.1 DUF2185 domain-containing protein [Acetatifactor sp.]
MEQIVKEIEKLKLQYESVPVNASAKAVSREEFTLLLGGVSACRKVPGIHEHMGYECLYHCGNEEDIRQAREHLARLFGVKDRESLEKQCYRLYSGSNQYEQFMTFWNNAPMFDLKELNPDGLKGFTYCKNIAEKFYPLVKEKGFYAWDINERIGLCRNAAACGIISDEEFWEMTDEWVCQAQAFYHSYTEYAVSCLCGALYDMGRSEPDVSAFYEINRNIIAHLLGEDGAWNRNKWYVPEKREWASLLDGNPGCIITKRALEEERIDYMYRDEPSSGYPDSGWRFFVGDEPEEYVNNPDNSTICGLNTICNLSPDIMAFIYAGIGRRFGRQENGWEEE